MNPVSSHSILSICVVHTHTHTLCTAPIEMIASSSTFSSDTATTTATIATEESSVPVPAPIPAPIVIRTHFCDDPETIEIAVDEVGRGCLFGRVYAAAVVLPKSPNNIETIRDEKNKIGFTDLRDSKKITSKKRRKLIAEYIQKNAVASSVAWEEADSIDSLNILQATQKAMHTAIGNVISQLRNRFTEEHLQRHLLIVVDGNYFNPYHWLTQRTSASIEASVSTTPILTPRVTPVATYTTLSLVTNKNKAKRTAPLPPSVAQTPRNTDSQMVVHVVPHVLVPHGDAICRCIGAASILAKETRDAYITDLCELQPELTERYGIGKNMGYGTSAHMKGIKQHGIVAGHRLSFAPCRNASTPISTSTSTSTNAHIIDDMND